MEQSAERACDDRENFIINQPGSLRCSCQNNTRLGTCAENSVFRAVQVPEPAACHFLGIETEKGIVRMRKRLKAHLGDYMGQTTATMCQVSMLARCNFPLTR